ncbi:TIGR02556 family CRISPR-associated protein [Thermodesulfovibrio sp. 3907-1M]|uniref:TIGR02556 family CRISPR-associated protein n=1 Tax=Thermodesulfovibrio autotrophicus TaxID=3118333 RepID=A0AAU8H244_9BACT
MLSAVKEIGNLVAQPTLKIEGKIIFLVLCSDFSFKGIEIEDFIPEKIDRYLYKPGESKGNRPSPFAPINRKEPEKSFEKIAKWLKNSEKIINLTEQELDKVKKINDTLQREKVKILQVISNKSKEISKKTSLFLGLKIGDKYLGDFDLFKNIFNLKISQRIGKSSSRDKTCSICGEVKDTVSARTYVYQFDTDDKPGFITGFKKENYWKNIPVCQDCRDLLQRGRNFIEDKLTFKFYGLKYQLIPKFLLGGQDIIKEILDILSDTHKNISLKERKINRLTDDEQEILEYISEKEDALTLNFLFLRRQQSAERILLLIEDVFPSRLREIFNAKRYVDELFNEEFNFGKIRVFFSKSDDEKRETDLDKYFLEIVNSVFKDKKIDFNFLLKFFMNGIRKDFINDNFYKLKIRDAMMCVSFFENLGLIKFKEVPMEQNIFEEVFNKYGKSLNTPEKRGIFLLGALTQMLLNKQYSERESKPFMKKLKSLKMDEKDIKALLPEVQNKLEEYEAFDKGKRLIAQEASKYLLQAGDGWKMSVYEINFYFACGMNMSEEVAKIVYRISPSVEDEKK